MNAENFARLQPVAWQAVTRSIRNEHFAHAYLLSGGEGVELQEYAEFIVQSHLCEQPVDGLACGCCNNCQRVARGSYSDLVVIDGSQKRIGKNEILQMMNQLNKTGLEGKGLKFYLIEEVDNATTEAMNSLLKFLEEPGNELTYAILTTHRIDKVLPTITSRCLQLPFWGYRKSVILANLTGVRNDESEYYLLSNIAKNPDKAVVLQQNETFVKTLSLFREYLSLFKSNAHEALVLIQKEGLNDKKLDKEFLTHWLNLNIQFFKDLHYVKLIPHGWYQQLLSEYQAYDQFSGRLLPLFLEAFDRLEKPLNLSLLVEKLFWQLQEVQHEYQ